MSKLGTVVELMANHPLIGRWRMDENDGRSEYLITANTGKIDVAGRDYIDGEVYRITNIRWTAESLEFETYMSSTKRRGHLKFYLLDTEDQPMVEFTFTDTCRAERVSL